jgi:hypothetical protein
MILFISCSDHSTRSVFTDSVQNKATFDTAAIIENGDTFQTTGTNLYVWQVDFEKKTKTKNPQFQGQYLNVDTLIKGLNELYPRIQLEKIRISNDTLYTEIKDSYYLGESIGIDGANAYIADAVINLTAVKNIDFVKFDFEDGSHISSGTWKRKDFEKYTVKK